MSAACCSNTKQCWYEECYVDQNINKALGFVNFWSSTCALAIVFSYTRWFIMFWNET